MDQHIDIFDLGPHVGGGRQFKHRGSQADLGVIEQIFTRREYALEQLYRGAEFLSDFQRLTSENRKPLIVDCGANIGASVVWFATSFAGSHIVAIEPDAANFELLTCNTGGLDVDLRLAAVGSVDGKVNVIDPGEGEWGYRTARDASGACDLLSLKNLVDAKVRMGFTPFLIKIDIEGGEADLFAAATDWVAQFPVVIIELHDWLLPKQGTSRNFLKCIANHDRDFVYLGENVFSLQNR